MSLSRRRRQDWQFALAMLLLACTLSTGATTTIPLDLAELTASARAIARGDVIDVRSEWAPGRRRVQTRVTIAVSEFFKGRVSSPVTLVVPGGRMGRYQSIVVGAPRFERGQSVVVFLGWEESASPYLVGFSQGLFRVVRDGAGRREIVTPRPLVAMSRDVEAIRRGDPERPMLALSEFRNLVRELAAKGPQ